MAFTCGFFNSVAHDRKYDAVQHGMIFDGIITDGIYATYLKAMVVKASENASEVIVQPGRAWFNHTWSYNDSDYPVAAPEPEVVLDRIDTLVLDVNSEDAVRNNQFLWVQGTPTSQTPEPPTLIHTATHNQYPLCDVYRQAGTTMIYAADITNRVGTSDCPFVTGVLESIDIDDLLAQWDDEFHTWENATKASFEGWMLNQQQVYTAWFNALKTQMAGDVADVEAWVQTIKDIIDKETATHLQLEIDEINSMLPSGSHITVTTSDTELYSRTVTITDEDNNTVTSQFDANGVAVFKSVPYVGNLTITSTDGVRTATEVVSTPYFARYEFTLAFWSATVNIIGDSVLGGDTVTITDSTTALVGTVVLNASGTGVFNATYPDIYKFSVTHGGETMEVSLAVTQETTYNVEIHSGLNYQAWLNAGRVSKSFSSLDDVLADEKTLRQLFFVHDAVDYVSSQRVNNDLTKIFNTNLAAKWINNSDYALDKFYAVADIKTVMDAAGKYGYGEWVNNNGTWGPKGNVPVMTSNTAPYGECIGTTAYQGALWNLFDGDPSTKYTPNPWATTTWQIGYKFTNPVCVRRLYYRGRGYDSDYTLEKIMLQASNDGTNWTDIQACSCAYGTIEYTWDIDNDDYYLYYRITNNGSTHAIELSTLQFYGRELKVSVPTMTSNTAPFGTAGASSEKTDSSYYAYKAFDNSSSTKWASATSGSAASGEKLWYRFTNSVKPIMVRIDFESSSDRQRIQKATLVGSSNGTSWENISDLGAPFSNNTTYIMVTNPNKAYPYIGVKFDTVTDRIVVTTLQFYGKDYSEKEFEVGTTKKWLYDHGVELEEMTLTNTNANATGEKRSNEVLIAKTGTSNASQVVTPLDLTPYNLLRCVLGDEMSTNVSDGTCGRLLVLSSALIDISNMSNIVAANVIHVPSDKNIPNNISVGVESCNNTYYVGLEVHGESNYTMRNTLKELWLE